MPRVCVDHTCVPVIRPGRTGTYYMGTAAAKPTPTTLLTTPALWCGHTPWTPTSLRGVYMYGAGWPPGALQFCVQTLCMCACACSCVGPIVLLLLLLLFVRGPRAGPASWCRCGSWTTRAVQTFVATASAMCHQGLACTTCVWALGVVWCGVVWCGVIWCGVICCGVVWCGVPGHRQ